MNRVLGMLIVGGGDLASQHRDVSDVDPSAWRTVDRGVIGLTRVRQLVAR